MTASLDIYVSTICASLVATVMMTVQAVNLAETTSASIHAAQTHVDQMHSAQFQIKELPALVEKVLYLTLQLRLPVLERQPNLVLRIVNVQQETSVLTNSVGHFVHQMLDVSATSDVMHLEYVSRYVEEIMIVEMMKFVKNLFV